MKIDLEDYVDSLCRIRLRDGKRVVARVERAKITRDDRTYLVYMEPFHRVYFHNGKYSYIESSLDIVDIIRIGNLTETETSEEISKNKTQILSQIDKTQEQLNKLQEQLKQVKEQNSSFEKVIKEYFERNRKLTLYEEFLNFAERGNLGQDKEEMASQLVDIVREWLPREDPRPSYATMQWDKCVRNLHERLTPELLKPE